jgi:hypothetical protein
MTMTDPAHRQALIEGIAQQAERIYLQLHSMLSEASLHDIHMPRVLEEDARAALLRLPTALRGQPVTWRFEGGPWDGHQVEQHHDLLLPMVQVVTVPGQAPVRYELVTKQEPDTFIYRPVVQRAHKAGEARR